MQFALLRALPGAKIESAGQHTRDGSPICAVVRERIGAAGAVFADRFRSRRINGVDVAEFDIVLTATLDLRSDLARANPDTIERIFTLREAALLLGVLPGGGGLARQTATELAVAMNASRGNLSRARPALGWPGRRQADPFDINDEHGAHGRRHHRTVGTTLQVGEMIGTALSSRLARSTASHST